MRTRLKLVVMNLYLLFVVLRSKIFRKTIVFFDIGELGWSLYLSGHVQWLKRKGGRVGVFTSMDRQVLFQSADFVKCLPAAYLERYGHFAQDCYGVIGVSPDEMKGYLRQFLSANMIMPSYFQYGWNTSRTEISVRKAFHAPYKVSKHYPNRNILVFPRCRLSSLHAIRNLPKMFYEYLIMRLCEEFPECEIISLGAKGGAYDIAVNAMNYRNCVGSSTSIQDLVNFSSNCIGAIGGTSAPPKITLLQGVPTYVVGHEKEFFSQTDNWMRTPIGFWEISEAEYMNFNDTACIDDAISFFKKHMSS